MISDHGAIEKIISNFTSFHFGIDRALILSIRQCLHAPFGPSQKDLTINTLVLPVL